MANLTSMRTKLLLVVLCLGAALLPSPASARKTLCTQEEFMTQSLEYTPEVWRLTLDFDMSCLPKGADLTIDMEHGADGLLAGVEGGFHQVCSPRNPCSVVLEEQHDPVERADYWVSFLLWSSGGKGRGIESGQGDGAWTCTSIAASASCE